MSVQPIKLFPAFILHRRPYRETSALVDLIIEDVGVQRAVFRGVYARSKKFSPGIDPFTPILIKGRFQRGQLSTVHDFERVADLGFLLKGNALACGFYLNELLLKFSAIANDASIFPAYKSALLALSTGEFDQNLVLRQFELALFVAAGLDIPDMLGPDCDYCFYHPEQGIVDASIPGAIKLSNKSIQTWTEQCEHFYDDAVALKKLHKQIIYFFLGPVEFNSRMLFSKASSQT